MRRLTALALLLSLPVPAHAQDADSRAFRDWTAACDASGYCAATTTARSGTLPPGSATLVAARHARQPYWELSYATVGATATDPWSDVTVTVDGTPEVFAPPSAVGAYGAEAGIYLLGDSAQAVMDRLMPGTSAAIAFTGLDGQPHEASFSLSGLTAALIWIDERQGRIGSERVAFAPPYGLVPTDAAGSPPAIPLALLDRLRADPDCRPLEDLVSARDFAVADLGGGQTLYLLPCQAGAYNFGHKVFTSPDGVDFYPEYFASYGADIGWTGTPYLWNGGYDEATRTLTSFLKARGIGDCGAQGTWVWNGHTFVLTEMRARDCSGDIDPDDDLPEFPIVYQHTPVVTP